VTARDHPNDTALLAFAAGTLGEARQAEIAAHLEGCAQCRGFARGLEHVGGELVDDLKPVSLADGSLSRTLAQLDRLPASTGAVAGPGALATPATAGGMRQRSRWAAGPRTWPSRRLASLGWAAAAMIVLTLGVAVLAPEIAPFAYGDDFPDSTATTGTVPIGGATAGRIERQGDVDWFRVHLTEGTTYRFRLEGSDTGRGTLQHPVLRLLDGSGRQLPSDAGTLDGAGRGWTSTLVYRATETGVHYLSSEAHGGDRGTYTVSATAHTRMSGINRRCTILNCGLSLSLICWKFDFCVAAFQT